MKESFVDIEYHEGVMAYTSCRWTAVVGYDDKTHPEDSYADCYCFPVKPTKKQIRRLMKLARQMRMESFIESSWEDCIIDRLGWDVQ